MVHKPVLLNEVLEYLDVAPGRNFIDGTVGEGGHTVAILEKNAPNGKVLGLDADALQIENAKRRLGETGGRAVLVHSSYVHMEEMVAQQGFAPVYGILLDLGYSSWHMEVSGKGFSFGKDEVLDMRYDVKNPLTAQKIINEYSEHELEKIIEEFGEERFAGRIAKAIVDARHKAYIKTTGELVGIIKEAVPVKFQHGGIHYATRTFQALRIAVNNELGAIQAALPKAFELLEKGGRLVVISFHSLEDRIVKQFFVNLKEENKGQILTKKPVTAGENEVRENPRSRSAKLRAIVKI